MFNNINDIKKAGFTGFKTMRALFIDSSSLPSFKGVYLILYPNNNQPSFLQVGSGGYFKGRNPNIPIQELKKNWVENTIVIYIGKAGSDDSNTTLKSRLKQYFGFGQGKNIGHWGGRLIWQMSASKDLIVCWKPIPNEEPRTVERQLIQEFVTQYGHRPFANLAN